MRPFLLAAIILVCTTLIASAQAVSLYNVDATQFPVMKAKFYALDATGGQARPSASELALTEDGIPRTITSVSCPPAPPPQALSSVLVIDVSGSMSISVPPGTRMDVAKAAANAWINALPLGQSECAITSFDKHNYLNQDFITDRAKLTAAVGALKPQGGTDYDQGLLLASAGGLQVSKNGKHRRVIVFLTDGAGSTPQTSAIIAEAQRQNCIIYAVTLGMQCPQTLKDITTQTGGGWFENVTTTPEAERVYRQILRQIQGGEPCDITWQSDVPCAPGNRVVSLTWNGQTRQQTYAIPATAIPELKLSPTTLYCRAKPVGVKFDTTITVTALNAPATVTGITSSNSAFDINPKSFTLAAGASRTLTVSYTPPDSSYAWARFDIATSTCPEVYFASGSYPGAKVVRPTLKLDRPNGGERLVAGSDTVITWSGMPLSDTVTLEYSTDNGVSWQVITELATGGSYAWHVPNTPSTQCLARVKQLLSGASNRRGWVRQVGGTVNDFGADIAVDTAGNFYVTGRCSGTIDFGGITLTTTSTAIYIAKYRPDGTAVWVKSVGGGIRGSESDAIAVDNAGNVYVTGYYQGTVDFEGTTLTTSKPATDIFVAKFRSDGTLAWAKSGGAGWEIHNTGNGIAVDALGNVYVTGFFFGSAQFDTVKLTGIDSDAPDIFLVKYRSDGSVEWAKVAGGTGWDRGRDLALDVFGNVYVTGEFQGPADFDAVTLTSAGGGGGDFFMAKYHPDGSLEWAKSFGGSGLIEVNTMTLDVAGNIYLAGHFASTLDFGRGITLNAELVDIYIAKFQPDANIEWAFRAGGSEFDSPSDIAVDAAGNIYTSGQFQATADFGGDKRIADGIRSDIFVLKQHSDGSAEWVKTTGGNDTDLGRGIALDPSGVPYVVGTFGVIVEFPNNRLVTAGLFDVFIWKIGDEALQTDTSDAVFSIVAPAPRSQDVDMGDVVVATSRDSVVQRFVRNTGAYPFNVRDIQITGADASQFTIVSGLPPVDIGLSGGHPVEFRFQPTSPGDKSAQVLVITQTDTLRQTIRGKGVAPSLVVVDTIIDFGQVNVGTPRERQGVATIRNIGTTTLQITGTPHAGPNDKDFSTLAGGGSFQLPPGDTAKLDLRFVPSDIGRTSGQLLFEYNGIGSPAVVQLFGEGVAAGSAAVDVINDVIDFGRVAVGGQKDTVQVVTIANVGSAPLTITSIRHADPTNSDFITLAGGNPPPVPPGDTVRLDLRFAPSAVGVRNGTLLFDYATTGWPATVQLTGEGVAAAESQAAIATGEAAAYPGDEVDVAIILNEDVNIAQSGATNLTATLRFNATLLDPIGSTPRGTISGDERVIPLELPVARQSGDVLATLRFRAMLGNDTATALTLENPGAVGGTVAVRAESGTFRLLGVCMDGGVRLLNPTGLVKIVAVRPNPVGEEAEVEIETVEAGRTRVVVIDMMGREVASVYDGELPQGRHILPLGTHQLITGSYYVLLTTPTVRSVRRVDIVK